MPDTNQTRPLTLSISLPLLYTHTHTPLLSSIPSVLTVGYRERPADTRKTEAGVHSASSPNAEREAEDGWWLSKGNEGGEGREREREEKGSGDQPQNSKPKQTYLSTQPPPVLPSHE